MTDETALTPDALQWLAEARARYEAVTPGPWSTYRDEDTSFYGITTTDDMWVAEAGSKCDAEFIAHARADLPRALDLIVLLTRVVRP